MFVNYEFESARIVIGKYFHRMRKIRSVRGQSKVDLHHIVMR